MLPFYQNISVNTFSELTSIIVKYSLSVCVTGFNFVYKNGTVVSTGYSGSQTTTLDLNSKRLYRIRSYCAVICDYVEFCTIDILTSVISCIYPGKPGGSTLGNPFYCDKYCITGFYAEFFDFSGNLCLKNLGAFYVN